MLSEELGIAKLKARLGFSAKSLCDKYLIKKKVLQKVTKLLNQTPTQLD